MIRFELEVDGEYTTFTADYYLEEPGDCNHWRGLLSIESITREDGVVYDEDEFLEFCQDIGQPPPDFSRKLFDNARW
jgi:hypothetical protein